MKINEQKKHLNIKSNFKAELSKEEVKEIRFTIHTVFIPALELKIGFREEFALEQWFNLYFQKTGENYTITIPYIDGLKEVKKVPEKEMPSIGTTEEAFKRAIECFLVIKESFYDGRLPSILLPEIPFGHEVGGNLDDALTYVYKQNYLKKDKEEIYALFLEELLPSWWMNLLDRETVTELLRYFFDKMYELLCRYI